MRIVNAAVLAAAVVALAAGAGSAQAQSTTPATKKDVRELRRDHRELVTDAICCDRVDRKPFA